MKFNVRYNGQQELVDAPSLETAKEIILAAFPELVGNVEFDVDESTFPMTINVSKVRGGKG